MRGTDTPPRPLLPAPRPQLCLPVFLHRPKQAPSSSSWWKAGGRNLAEGVFVQACVHPTCCPGSQLLVLGAPGEGRPQWSSWYDTQMCVPPGGRWASQGWVRCPGSDAGGLLRAVSSSRGSSEA